MGQLLVLAVLVPLLAFFATLVWQNKNEQPIAWIVRVAKVLNIGLALLFVSWWMLDGLTPVDYQLITLYKSDHFVFALHFYYDEVTAVFSLTGAVLFFLVATFSKYYMHRDQGFKRYFNTILLFSTAYNLIILSGNFETLFIGWEIKGICSFLLIAFYRDRYLPVKNAFKAVSNYRISDVSLMLAMWMMHHLMQQNISFPQLGLAKETALTTATPFMSVFIVCMMILPAVVKSAQFPFTTWLPRALEGPTASSAIFYGSLSVHIGVFLLLRTHPFWEDMRWAKTLIIVIGALTAITATVIARVQPTVKTQIAYSSAAQIGLMFIEIALGFHWLVLLHFAGNAFLRTYQLLVSPSVLNYLVHHQIFHYTAPVHKAVTRWKATLYILGVKEWNLDALLYRTGWKPFKLLGNLFGFLQHKTFINTMSVIGVFLFIAGYNKPDSFQPGISGMTLLLMAVALLQILFSFSSRGNAITAWRYLLNGHIFILAGILFNAPHIYSIELIFYASGVILAFGLGYYCLRKIERIDMDITLSRFHGYVYEQENTGFLFLLSAMGMLGFPITAAFIGIDVLFTYVRSDQWGLIALLGLSLFFVELAAFRILLRIFFGPHKKLYHPVAFRST